MYPNISESGTKAVIIFACHLFHISSILPLLLFNWPITSPIYSSGVLTSTFIIGSNNVAWALLQASWNAFEAANLNANSEESTSW